MQDFKSNFAPMDDFDQAIDEAAGVSFADNSLQYGQLTDDLKVLLTTAQGRRFFSYLAATCRYGEVSKGDFERGKQSVAVDIFKIIKAVNREAFAAILKEI